MPSAARPQVFARSNKLRGIAHARGNYWSFVSLCVFIDVFVVVFRFSDTMY